MGIIIKKTIRVSGMTCSSCENRIESCIKKMAGVLEVRADYATSTVTVAYDQDKVGVDEFTQAIGALGYTVEKRPADYRSCLFAGTILLGAYLILKNTVGFNFIPQISQEMSYAVLFIVGLLTSVHCVAMCGGINLSVCVSPKFEKGSGTFSKLAPSLMYNAGRVVSYTVIGGVVGALGAVFSISNTGKAIISVAAGIFMVIMGLNMLNLFPWLRKLNPHLPRSFAGKINRQKKNKGPFVVGLLNGLMPCGPLQAMQLYALGTGSLAAGAFSMFMFSLGTVPLVFAFGAAGSMLSARFTKKLIRFSALLVVVLGVVMVNRGVAFTGFVFLPSASDSQDTEENMQFTAVTDGDVQTITTVLESGKYPAITVEQGIPVTWTIVAKKENLNGCNNKIIIPQYNIEKDLVVGENVITFTPEKAGAFGYSCWMGMIRSNITVTGKDYLGTQGNDLPGSPGSGIDNSGLPSGCCGY